MSERYEIVEKISESARGTVYRANDLRLQREVALKRFKLDSKEVSEETRMLLGKTAGALASLNHPHVVKVYDFGTDKEGSFFVMELLTGKPLEDVVQSGALLIEDFLRLSRQTLEAMVAATDAGLVHLNLNPNNIMFEWLPSGRFLIKVLDFSLPDTPNVAQPSILCTAPEIFKKKPVTIQSNLYTLGCIFYYSLTGYYPFEGDTPEMVKKGHLSGNIRPLNELRPDIPWPVCEWVMRLLNRKPADRPENLAVVLEQLDGFATAYQFGITTRQVTLTPEEQAQQAALEQQNQEAELAAGGGEKRSLSKRLGNLFGVRKPA